MDNYVRSAAASSRQLPGDSRLRRSGRRANLKVPVEFRSMSGPDRLTRILWEQQLRTFVPFSGGDRVVCFTEAMEPGLKFMIRQQGNEPWGWRSTSALLVERHRDPIAAPAVLTGNQVSPLSCSWMAGTRDALVHVLCPGWMFFLKTHLDPPAGL